MRRELYRSLDRPSAFFGIRGRFKTWFAILLGISLFVALMVSSMTEGFFGYIAFFIAAGVSYGFILMMQDKGTDRELTIKMNSHRYVKFIKVPPFAVRHLWRHDRLDG